MASITSTELCDVLGVTVDRLKKWRTAGMPHSKDGRKITYEEHEVSAWLVNTGKAEEVLHRQQQICKTVKELALAVGKREATIYDWLRTPGCPGRKGYYPVDDILEFHAEKIEPKSNHKGDTSLLQRRLIEQKVQSGDIKIGRELDALVPVERVARVVDRINSSAKQVIDEIPGMVMAHVPAEIPDVARAEMQRKITAAIELAKETISNSVLNDLVDGT